MNDRDTISDAEEAETRPRKPRQPKAERKVFVYRLIDGKPKEQGSFPEAVIGDPLERRLPTFLKEMFGAGDYKTELRKTNGHYERSFDFSIVDTESEPERIIDVEPETDNDEAEPDYDITSEIELRAELIAMRREVRELKDRERERQSSVRDSENNTLAMIREMQAQSEKSFQQGLQMAQMIMQSSTPKENPSELMLSMLKGTLEVQRGVRQLSEEIAPSSSTESGGSLIADGARLIDSLGRNAGTFLPILSGLIPKPPSIAAPVHLRDSSEPTNSGELANLAEQIQNRKNGKAEKEGASKK